MNSQAVRNALRQNLIKLGVMTVIAVGTASASVVGIYGGIDNGAGPGGPFSNSTVAETQFWAALAVSSPTITFEGVSSLSNVGGGVSVTISNNEVQNGIPLGGLVTGDQHIPEALGFNITTGGNTWLQFYPQFSSPGVTATFNFPSAINAFGLWLTDTQTNMPGQITITLNDGTAEVLNLPKNGQNASGAYAGGAEYYAFITNSPFTSLTINGGATTGLRDVFGIDNITFGTAAGPFDPLVPSDVPEPGTWSLVLGAALVTIGLGFRSRKRPAQPATVSSVGRDRA